MENTLFSKKDYSEKIIYYLMVLLPITLVSGPFLSDLSISIITVIFIYISYTKKLYFYYQNKYSKIFALFFIILIITSFFSLDPIISFKKVIFFFRFWIFALAVWYILDCKNNLIKHLIISFTLIFIILIIDGYIQYFFKENIFGWPMQGVRLSSLFKDELILGSYLSRMLPIFFALLIFTKFDKKIYKYFLFFLIFVGIETLIFLSGERAAFFFVNASSLMLIITMKNYKIFRIFSIITSILLIFVLINYYPESKDRIINKTIVQSGFEKSDKSITLRNNENKNENNSENVKLNQKYIFSIEHHNHYVSSLKMFMDNKLTGIGPRMFRFICPLEKYNLWEGCSTHPHNTYVQLLAETGLIGFIFGLIIFLIIFSSIIKHFIYKFIKNNIIFNDYQLCLLAAILISLWPFVPTGGLFNNWLNIIYFFPAGFYLNSVYSKNR